MTAQWWLKCTDPWEMLRQVGNLGTTYRKARLFCCAYCRWFFWDYLPPRVQDSIAIAEAYADQAASKYKLRKAHHVCGALASGITSNAEWRANLVAQMVTDPHDPFRTACYLLDHRSTLPWRGGKKAVASLVREIFGNPFRPVALEPGWLAWQRGTVRKLAQAIYEDRAFDRLPVLADALEEAGCDDADVLTHCRGPGPHARGCRVVDFLLEKP